MNPLRANDYIFVDGVKVTIRWRGIGKGSSFFIPCLNTKRVVRQVKKLFSRAGWGLFYIVRVENGLFGVRIWRVL